MVSYKYRLPNLSWVDDFFFFTQIANNFNGNKSVSVNYHFRFTSSFICKKLAMVPIIHFFFFKQRLIILLYSHFTRNASKPLKLSEYSILLSILDAHIPGQSADSPWDIHTRNHPVRMECNQTRKDCHSTLRRCLHQHQFRHAVEKIYCYINR